MKKRNPTSAHAKRPSKQKGSITALVPKLGSHKFTFRNAADSNRVFLYEVAGGGGMKPIKGWKIVGYGQAPWPGSTEGFAVMFEKETPAEERRAFMANEKIFEEGARIWQHYRKHWITTSVGCASTQGALTVTPNSLSPSSTQQADKE